MKKSTIWLIATVMGVCFLTLLYLQTKYFKEVMDMRAEQFDESVTRSLSSAARNLELAETKAGLEKQFRETMGQKNANDSLYIKGAKQDSTNNEQHNEIPANVQKGMFLDNLNANSVPEGLRDSVRERYLYQQSLLNEVVYSILYKAGEKPIGERVDFRMLDSNLRSELHSNGIDIDYHFYVTTSDGREVYRCTDYSPEGSRFTYRQVLYPNDPSAQTGILYVHFPGKLRYIFSTAKFILPAIIFTLVLLIVFIFTIFTIFRQKRLTEIKNDFINNMTHEFKTPISSISLAAQMLGDPAIAKNETMFRHISSVITDETKRLRFQVEKVLQMSMFDRKAATFKCKEVDANIIVNDTVNTFRLKVEANGGKIEAFLDAEDAIVYVDEMHFTNVIFNLLDNAVKYKAEGRNLHLIVRSSNDAHKLTISIEDNGIGIKKEDLKKIFEKFYRVHTGNRHDVKGFGLGLAYVHSVVKALDGNIHAESKLGQGTKFVITLPLMQ